MNERTPPASRQSSSAASRHEYADLVAALPRIERELAEAQGRARALQDIVLGIRALQGDESALLDPNFHRHVHGRTREAFLAVMDGSPRRAWKLTEIRRRIMAAGAAPSIKAVDAAARRLRDEGTVVQPRYGYYMYPDGDHA